MSPVLQAACVRCVSVRPKIKCVRELLPLCECACAPIRTCVCACVCVSCNRNSHKNSTAALQLQNVFAANLLRQFRYLSPLTHVSVYVCVCLYVYAFLPATGECNFSHTGLGLPYFHSFPFAQVQVLGRISANSNYFSMTSSSGLCVSSLCGLSVNPRTLLSNQLLHMCACDEC